jgi:hypothetical protein
MNKDKLSSEIAETITNVLTAGIFSIDDYLDSRDELPFDQNWADAYADIEKKKSQLPKKAIKSINEESENFREIVFKQVFRVTQSHDLSAYISDDAGLILEDHLIEAKNQWVAALESCYSAFKLPSGAL